jgi:hypothetical protein
MGIIILILKYGVIIAVGLFIIAMVWNIIDTVIKYEDGTLSDDL